MKISKPIKQREYDRRIKENGKILASKKDELKNKLNELIQTKIDNGKNKSENDLTDADYRDILDSLHHANGEFHHLLNDVGLKTVSKYSFFSNQRATEKIEALKNYLGIQFQSVKQEPSTNLKQSNTGYNTSNIKLSLQNDTVNNKINKFKDDMVINLGENLEEMINKNTFGNITQKNQIKKDYDRSTAYSLKVGDKKCCISEYVNKDTLQLQNVDPLKSLTDQQKKSYHC